MNRLSLYLFRLFTRDTLGLLGIMLGLLFLVQCLKIFDVVAVQSQSLWTLVGQALLGMPEFAIVLGYVCMGIAIVRVLGSLQATHELHIIHANRRLGALFGGVALFAVSGAVVLLFMSNVVEPWANRRLDDWAATVAADIVGRTLTPHKFSQVVPGVTFVIGGRGEGGLVSDLFADDRRDPKMRHTYIAKSAKIADADQGYVLELYDGSLQYFTDKGNFSQVGFKTYDVGLNRLTEQVDNHDQLGEKTSAEIVAQAAASGTWSDDALHRLGDRGAEGLRAIAMCLFMAGLAAFPHARRGRNWLPLELVPILVAYADKTVTSSVQAPGFAAPFAGPAVVLGAAVLLLAWRLRPRLVRPA